MAVRRRTDPSPFRSAITHGALSVCVFGAVAGAAAAIIHLSGDRRDAGPVLRVALFDVRQAPPPALKARLAGETAGAPVFAAYDEGDEPDLGVPDPDGAAPAAGSGGEAALVRINGTLVRAGQSYSEAAAVAELPAAPMSGLSEGRLPKIGDDGLRPLEAYARPAPIAQGRPRVAVVVGGLGINHRQALAVIDQLPGEITLSFTPDAARLQSLIDKARADGHEVLIEAPMEPFESGRGKPYAHRLEADLSAEQILARLERTLSRASGYFGVVNHQGSRFAAEAANVAPVAEALRDRGLAFVDDGSVQNSMLAASAADAGAAYVKADFVIDVENDADEMTTQLLALETRARETGAALGTAFAYPLTVDVLAEWVSSLEAKGLALTPASAMLVDAAAAPISIQTDARAAPTAGRTG